MGHSASCVVCATPAHETYGGSPVHGGECLRQLKERSTTPAPAPAEPPAPPAPRPESVHDRASAEAQDSPSLLAPARDDIPVAGSLYVPVPSVTDRLDRFAAPLAAIDETTVYLPGGAIHP